MEISVIIPVYNGQRFLAQAVNSVLKQTVPPGEVIVVDDGSTDGSADIARSFPTPVCTIFQENKGPAAARNAGVKEARGQLIAFLDADDIWLPEKLARQTDLWRQNQEAIVLCRFHPRFHEDGQWMDAGKKVFFQSDPVCTMPSGLLLSRKTWMRIGEFEERYRTGEDTEWFIRSRRHGIPQLIVEDVLVHKGIHRANLTAQAPNAPLFKSLRNFINRDKNR